eukprot:s4692_g2.t1
MDPVISSMLPGNCETEIAPSLPEQAASLANLAPFRASAETNGGTTFWLVLPWGPGRSLNPQVCDTVIPVKWPVIQCQWTLVQRLAVATVL